METLPMPLDSLARQNGGLDEFRISSPREIVQMLRQLQDGSVRLNFVADDGLSLPTMLWAVDSAGAMLSYNADARDPRTQRLLELEDAVVVGYLDSIKLQFDAGELVLVRGPAGAVLRGRIPPVLYRFQRRNSFRVRPLAGSSPVARLVHPALPERALTLRVLDVSIGGCALLLPHDVPAVEPGVRAEGVEFVLDADTGFVADLDLLHINSIGADSHGVRLGCRFVRLGAETERVLQRFIDQTQKRRRLMSLD